MLPMKLFYLNLTPIIIFLLHSIYPLVAFAEHQTNVISASSNVKKDITKWIDQLGAEDFHTRQQAMLKLRDQGQTALPQLSQVVQSSNLEIKHRAEQLIEIIRQQVFLSKIRSAVQSPQSIDEYQLPHWDRYRREIGPDAEAQRFYLQMLQKEVRLFYALEENNGDQIADELSQRLSTLQYMASHVHNKNRPELRKPSQITVCTLLFVCADPSLNISSQTHNYIYRYVCSSDFRDGLGTRSQNRPLRRLLGYWIRLPNASLQYQRLSTAMRYKMEQGLIPAMELIESQATGSQYQYAILAVGVLGNHQHLPLLERLMKDESVLYASSSKTKPFSCQVRDVALATAISLTRQNIASYKFPKIRANSRTNFSINSAGFYSEKTRQESFRKWNEWRKKHPHLVLLHAERP